MEEKKRYSDEELEEFRAIINQKLEDCKVWLWGNNEGVDEQKH